MNTSHLIIFTGIDGSGKSTLSRTLVERLEKENNKARYLWWFSAENSLMRRTLRLLSRGGKGETTENNEGTLPKSSPVQKLYQFIVLLDYQWQTFFHVYLPLMSGKNVICDRYVYDIVISFTKEFNYPEAKTRKMMSTLLRLSPKPDIAFFVDVPVEVAIQRKHDIPSIQHHEELRSLYNTFIRDEMICLDGTKSIAELNDNVWDIVKNQFNIKGDSNSE
ncbi:MAG: hypothetical protein SCH39_04290 [Methanosarcinales archaeon]|nr:hypothetical protein [Methanosarcinales archaeon]